MCSNLTQEGIYFIQIIASLHKMCPCHRHYTVKKFRNGENEVDQLFENFLGFFTKRFWCRCVWPEVFIQIRWRHMGIIRPLQAWKQSDLQSPSSLTYFIQFVLVMEKSMPNISITELVDETRGHFGGTVELTNFCYEIIIENTGKLPKTINNKLNSAFCSKGFLSSSQN